MLETEGQPYDWNTAMLSPCEMKLLLKAAFLKGRQQV